MDGDRLTIKILFYKDYDFSTYRENLASINYVLKYENKSYKSITVEINKEDLNIISKINDVWFIEPIDPPSVAENKTARTLHRSNTVNTQYVGGKKYNGEGINIMMQDDGLVGPHIDRQGRLDQSFCIGCSLCKDQPGLMLRVFYLSHFQASVMPRHKLDTAHLRTLSLIHSQNEQARKTGGSLLERTKKCIWLWTW